jgi:very-short-patch-repair endonuclease
VVVGFGLLSWRPTEAVEVQRHLITVALSLELDPGRKILRLRPTASGVQPHLEEEMLDPGQRPPETVRERVNKELENVATDLWSSDHLHGLLECYGNALSADAQYDRGYAAPRAISASPVVAFAPCLILRKRGNEGILGLVDAIIANIDDGTDIPPAVVQQVCIMDERDRGDGSAGGAADVDDDETYFPLPANREQRRIVEHMTSANGIVVEGPPGTGKSLTIANLICHLLATGKRVLVTSHTARALQVLRDKIPEPLRPLCVQALSDDAKGMDALEFSVKGITDRQLTWNPEDSEREKDRLTKDLAAVRERLQGAIHDQRAIRESEVYRHEGVAGTYSGTLAEIARQLKNEQERLGIIGDEVESEQVPSCTVEAFRQLLSVLEAHHGPLDDVQCNEAPDVSCFYEPDRFEQLLEEIAGFQHAASGPHSALGERFKNLPKEQRAEVEAGVRGFAGRLEQLCKRRTERWRDQAIADIFGGRERSWRGRLEDTLKKLRELGNLPRDVLDARVSGHEQYDPDALRHEAVVLLRCLKGRRGKRLRLRLFLPGDIRAAVGLLENVRVNGEPCADLDPLEALVHWTTAASLLATLDKEWASREELGEEAFRRRIERYEEACQLLGELLALMETAAGLSDRFAEACQDPGPTWRDPDDVQAYLRALACAEASASLKAREEEWRGLLNSIGAAARRHPGHPPLEDIAVAAAEREVDAYRHAYEILQAHRAEWERSNSAATTLRTVAQVAPVLAGELQERPADPKWQRLAEHWEDAWAWAAARTRVRDMTAPDADTRVAKRITDEQKHIQELLAQLASARAWAYCLERLTENQRVHLQAWSLAMRRIGKGTGKYANQHRRAARENIGHCQPAIPAWIMPIYRVAESVRPDQDRFDVAIIDEASQSGPEALVLLFLADKIVVVGDDKQIAPEPFANIEEVERLRRQYISDLPTSDALGPLSSFFDVAKIRYPTRIRLVEHFRCMPEIIQFSNELCYKAEPLIPLRQFGAGRLEPVVNAVNVPRGFTKGKARNVNQPEATAIARTIAELLRDTRYDGKTFGVISLLGNRQARVIESELLGLVDAKELHARRCVCGEAYAFQGDERDVMFLSMVSAPGPDSRIGVLAKASDERRFNVAMSRAKDQVWLFHSATLNDLSPKDLRAQLLRYCQNPTCKQQTVGGVDVEELAKRARNANRSDPADKPPAPFDSWFEVDVFLRIAARGYLVIPQHEVHGYFIDLAVVGQKGKLAVECDGDHWHGPEQWESDAGRQRDLERCGFPFFRIRESAFYLDPDAALEPLWEELKRQGIRASGETAEAEAAAACHTEPDDDAHTDRAMHAAPESFSEEAVCKKQDPTLPLYAEWEPHPLPDPLTASRDSVFDALIEIVREEGPATWRRVFDRYRIGLGLGKLMGPRRKRLEDRGHLAVSVGSLLESREVDSDNWYDGIVSLPDSERVRLRQRGPRALKDVPPSEIAELMRLRDLVHADDDWALKQVLDAYGLVRRTPEARAHVRAAVQMVKNQPALG